MKVPNISESEEVRTEEQKLQAIASQEQRVNERLQQLNLRKQVGLSNEEKETQVAAVLAGNSIPNDMDVETEMKKTFRELAVIQEANRVAQAQLAATQKAVARKICEGLRPEHDKLCKKLCAALTDAHSAWLELYAAKRALANQGAGFYGLFNPDPYEFLGSPTDKSTDFAEFMRDAARAGFCKELPR
jgi:hypothetical protein